MKYKNKTLHILLLILSMTSLKAASKLSWYDEPISYNKRYITHVEAVIIESLEQREWAVKQKEPGKVTAWLNDYKGYELVLDIHYNDEKISFEHVSYKKLN